MTEIVCQDKPRIPAYPQRRQRGIFSFKREYPPLNPQEKGFHIASEQLEELQCLPMLFPARGVAAFRTAIRFASAPTIRCCAAVGSFAALRMRHTPCGCRSAHLVGVQLNFRLPWHSSMRRAKQCRIPRRQSAAEQTSLAPHDSKARLRPVTTRRRFMAKPCTPHPIAQRVHLFKLQTANAAGSRASRSRLPMRSLGGSKGGYSLTRENGPLCHFPVRHREIIPPSRSES